MTHEGELLDIAQAAAFLNVSETSLRRWTNSGRLACLRVGRRRERRFRRADLLAFMESEPIPAQIATTRASGSERGLTIIGGRPIALSTHLCGLYANDQGRIKLAVTFLVEALGPGSAAFLLTPTQMRDGILDQLRLARPQLDRDIADGRLVLSEYRDSGPAQLEYWQALFDAALRGGARVLRVVGDTSDFSRKVSDEALVEYEAGYEQNLARRYPVVSLCQYDVRQLSGLQVLNALKGHRDNAAYPSEYWLG
jgi:transcriptional repressor of dcmA and dcmR